MVTLLAAIFTSVGAGDQAGSGGELIFAARLNTEMCESINIRGFLC